MAAIPPTTMSSPHWWDAPKKADYRQLSGSKTPPLLSRIQLSPLREKLVSPPTTLEDSLLKLLELLEERLWMPSVLLEGSHWRPSMLLEAWLLRRLALLFLPPLRTPWSSL